LNVLPSDYLVGYMKKGGWLHNIPCKDCSVGGGTKGSRRLESIYAEERKKGRGVLLQLWTYWT
jgi:hypothetical protein